MKAMRQFAVTAALLATLYLPGCGGSDGPAFAVTSIGLVGGAPGPVVAVEIQGGDDLQVRGRGFEDGATVDFGATPAAAVVFVSATELAVTTPAMAEGTVDLVVTNPDGSEARRANAVTFAIRPTLASVVAIEGPDAGQPVVSTDRTTEVEVAGTGFKPIARVYLGPTPVTTAFVDANTVRFTAPSLPTEGGHDIRVLNQGELDATLPQALRYTAEHSLAPYASTVDASRIRHLWRRAGFGATRNLVQRELTTSLTRSVDDLLNVRSDPQTDLIEQNALAFYGATPPPSGQLNQRSQQEWWIHLIKNNPNVFQDRLAFFLHDHFATSQRDMASNERWWIHEQIKLFRRFSLPVSQGGLDYDWRTLLVEICKDRAMLDWLDGTNSRRNSPNENFARELWELFMLGEGRGYTQADIVEAAKAFTGFDDVDVAGTDYQTVVYVAARHDERQKTIFGVTGLFGYDSISPYHESGTGFLADPRDTGGGVVALTLRERPVEASTFICRKLAVWFLYSDPSQELVDDLASTLRASNWNLRPVLRKMLLSKAMYSDRAVKGHIKSPVEYIFQFVRSTGYDVSESRIRGVLDSLAQALLDPPDVAGWPMDEAWMGGQAMVERINFVRTVVQDLDDVASLGQLLPAPGLRAPDQLVDHIAETLDVDLSPTARQMMMDYVTTTLDGNGAVVPFAYDPANDSHLVMKGRGLIYMIAQYHDGHRQ